MLLAVLLKRRASLFDEGGVVFGQGFDVLRGVRDGISGVEREGIGAYRLRRPLAGGMHVR